MVCRATLPDVNSQNGPIAPNSLGNSVMIPQYPASSAYVLSVAETQFLGGITKAIGNYFDSSVTSPPEVSCALSQLAISIVQSPLRAHPTLPLQT